MSKQTKFYENLANMTSSTAFYVHLPNRERGKGQRLSDVTLFIAVSALYICNKFKRCFRVIPHMVL